MFFFNFLHLQVICLNLTWYLIITIHLLWSFKIFLVIMLESIRISVLVILFYNFLYVTTRFYLKEWFSYDLKYNKSKGFILYEYCQMLLITLSVPGQYLCTVHFYSKKMYLLLQIVLIRNLITLIFMSSCVGYTVMKYAWKKCKITITQATS